MSTRANPETGRLPTRPALVRHSPRILACCHPRTSPTYGPKRLLTATLVFASCSFTQQTWRYLKVKVEVYRISFIKSKMDWSWLIHEYAIVFQTFDYCSPVSLSIHVNPRRLIADLHGQSLMAAEGEQLMKSSNHTWNAFKPCKS